MHYVISVEVFVIEKRRNIVEERWIISNVERVDQGWSVFPKKIKTGTCCQEVFGGGDISPRIYLIYDGEVYTPPSVISWKNKGGWNYTALNSLPSPRLLNSDYRVVVSVSVGDGSLPKSRLFRRRFKL